MEPILFSRFPGAKNNDVFFQMIDLDKGVSGEPYNVSLFLHVRTVLYSYILLPEAVCLVNSCLKLDYRRSGLSTWEYQFLYDHWSQAMLSSVSTWMGDCSSVAANPLSRLELISRPILVVGSVSMQSWQLGSVGCWVLFYKMIFFLSFCRISRNPSGQSGWSCPPTPCSTPASRPISSREDRESSSSGKENVRTCQH